MASCETTPPLDDAEFMRINDAARRYGVSRSTIERLLELGALRRHSIAGTRAVLINAQEIRSLIVPEEPGTAAETPA